MFGLDPERRRGRRIHGRPRAALLALVMAAWFAAAAPALASEAALYVPDHLARPGEELFLGAYLLRTGLLGMLQPGIQGELLRFFDPSDKPLGQVLTDASGYARIRYTAGTAGHRTITVRLAENPRYTAKACQGRVYVRGASASLLFVHVENGVLSVEHAASPWRPTRPAEPMPGVRVALEAMSHCRTLVYLSQASRRAAPGVRDMLEKEAFPSAPICLLERSLLEALGAAGEPTLDPADAWWKDRSRPAFLVTGDRRLAEAAAREAFGVFLLEPDIQGGSGREGRQEGGEEEAARITPVASWEQVRARCGCETPGCGRGGTGSEG